jgi:hypothetical protein
VIVTWLFAWGLYRIAPFCFCWVPTDVLSLGPCHVDREVDGPRWSGEYKGVWCTWVIFEVDVGGLDVLLFVAF